MDGLRKSPKKSIATSPQSPSRAMHNTAPSKKHPLPERPHKTSKSLLWRTIVITGFFLLLSFIGIVLFLGYKGIHTTRNIQIENKVSASFLSQVKRLTSSFITEHRTPLQGEDRGRVNILLLGRAGEQYPGKNLTDTVMIMSIDTNQKKVALLSLPRDLYAPIPNTNLFTKINSLYQYGINTREALSPLQKSVEEITGETINYFIVLDFDGFEKVIDTLGGISVDVVRDFHDERYPGKNYSYETFDIKKGWQTLDGATALKYVRERHNDPEGDFGRAKRQQQVIQAVKNKAFSASTLLNIFAINDLLDTLGENIQTNMELDDMKSFLELASALDTKNITTVVIDAWQKDSLLRVSHIQVGPVSAFILVPRIGNWDEIHEVSENIFHLDTIKKRHNQIVEEKASVLILYQTEDISLAKKFEQLIQDALSTEATSIVPLATLENRPEQSIIIERSTTEKFFSLDELLKKFSFKKETSLEFLPPETENSDFVIVLGDDITDTLSFEEILPDKETVDNASSSEPLPPQSKTEKKKKH